MSKKALGKGLEALFSSGEEREVPSEAFGGIGQFVDIGSIEANPDQPRKDFDEQALKELSESIKEKGVLQPVLVERKGDRFIIIAGERRYRASLLAGLEKIPVIEKKFTGEEKLEAALIENIQRENLSPIEEAKAYQMLMNTYNLGQEELARKIGKNRSTVANNLRLLKMPADMQNAISSGEITAGHARAVLSVINPADQRLLFNRIMTHGLSVRESEKQAADLNSGIRTSVGKEKKKSLPAAKDPDIEEVEQRFIDSLGTKVSLSGTLSRGKLEISFFSRDDLDRIYEIITRQDI